MKKLSYLLLFILLFFNTSCKDGISGCVDASANNYNPSASVNDECCYNCYTSLGYSLGEYCNYNVDFILENEFNGLIQCYSVNGDVVPASAQVGTAILDAQGNPVFWPYASFNIYCN
ncbi:MAG: hypothetical protein CL825_03335 [Crocinitomicaceae bacterium]|nr:hypothetical protein [Crocinitomicaceae bacterium]